MADQTKTYMTAAEYFNLPETNRLEELLDGELIVSPPPIPRHQDIVGNIFFLLRQQVPDGKVFTAPIALYLDERNIPEPDVVWISASSRCQIAEKRLEGPPELIVEVLSPSTARRDRGDKFDLYEKYGIREYWLVDPEADYLEVYVLKGNTFERQGLYGPEESFESAVLGGQVVALKPVFSLD